MGYFAKTMHDLPSQCKSEGSPSHGQTGEDNFGEGLVRLSVNRVLVTHILISIELQIIVYYYTTLLYDWNSQPQLI